MGASALPAVGGDEPDAPACTRESLAVAIERQDETLFTTPPWGKLAIGLDRMDEGLRRIHAWEDRDLVVSEADLATALRSARVILVADMHDRSHGVDLTLDTILTSRKAHGGAQWPGTLTVALEALPATIAAEIAPLPLEERPDFLEARVRGCWAWKCEHFEGLLARSAEPGMRWIGLGPAIKPLARLDRVPDSQRPVEGAVTWDEMLRNIADVDRHLDAVLEPRLGETVPDSQLVVMCGGVHLFRSERVMAACASGMACVLVCGVPEWEWAAAQREGPIAWRSPLRPFGGVYRVAPPGGIARLCRFYRERSPEVEPANIPAEVVRGCIQRLAAATTDPDREVASFALTRGTVSAKAVRQAVSEVRLDAEQHDKLISSMQLDSWTSSDAAALFAQLSQAPGEMVQMTLLWRWGLREVLPEFARLRCVAVLTDREGDSKWIATSAALLLGRRLVHAELAIPILVDGVSGGSNSPADTCIGLLARYGAKARPWLPAIRAAEAKIPEELRAIYHQAITSIEQDGPAVGVPLPGPEAASPALK